MKIDRVLIIRRLRVPESMEMAQECADSCEKHGVPYEFIDGIEFMSSEDAMKAVGVWLNPEQKNINRGRGVSQGNNNCHASHIKAWRRIVEIDKPCLILEHDVIVKGNVCDIDIIEDAVNHFGVRLGDATMYEPVSAIQKMTQIAKHVGGHAYAFTPKTAQWFITDAETNGVCINVDEFINKTCGKDMYLSDPPQCVCWPRKSTREWQDPDNKRVEIAPTTGFAESFTELVKKGLKR